MVDRNGNGIPDDQERKKYRAGQRVSGLPSGTSQRRGVNPFWDEVETKGFGFGGVVNPIRQLANFVGDAATNFATTFHGRRPSAGDRVGTGLGDSLFGVQRGYYDDLNRRPARNVRGSFPKAGAESEMQNSALPDYMSALTQAMELVRSMGGGEIPGISYDPLRNDARTRANEYDAKLGAMYDQLVQSIHGDADKINESYGTAIADTGARSDATQQNIQGASDAAQARNTQQLAALGLGEAAGNIIAEGRDLNTQTGNAIADAASRGQIANDALTQNQQSSISHNTNLAGAAGLEGAEQRARVGTELSQLLAQYDMEEQAANQQIAAQNAQARQSILGQAMSLAGNMYDADWRGQEYKDQLAQTMWDIQNQGSAVDPFQMGLNVYQQMAQAFPDTEQGDIVELLKAIMSAGKAYQ